MRTRFRKTTICLVAAAFFLTGCGSAMPNMTREQEEAVGEYAAMMLLKYDAGNRSRLVDLSQIEEAPEASTEEAPTETQEPVETLPIEETPVIEKPVSEEENTVSSMEAFFGLPEGIEISYQGAHTASSYPEENGGKEYFALDAAAGKSLLILSFDIANQTGENAEVDFFQQNVRYTVTVNGDVTRNTLTTMLLNDMSTYYGTIPAGESVNLVLIAEMEQEVLSRLSSVSLKLKNDATTYTISLQ